MYLLVWLIFEATTQKPTVGRIVRHIHRVVHLLLAMQYLTQGYGRSIPGEPVGISVDTNSDLVQPSSVEPNLRDSRWLCLFG